jgi:hypothetical protein
MACDCDCQMIKTIRNLIHHQTELENRLFILEMAMRGMDYDEEECDCGCGG